MKIGYWKKYFDNFLLLLRLFIINMSINMYFNLKVSYIILK